MSVWAWRMAQASKVVDGRDPDHVPWITSPITSPASHPHDPGGGPGLTSWRPASRRRPAGGGGAAVRHGAAAAGQYGSSAAGGGGGCIGQVAASSVPPSDSLECFNLSCLLLWHRDRRHERRRDRRQGPFPARLREPARSFIPRSHTAPSYPSAMPLPQSAR